MRKRSKIKLRLGWMERMIIIGEKLNGTIPRLGSSSKKSILKLTKKY